MLGQQRRARTGPKLAWRRPRIRHRLVRLADPWPPCRCGHGQGGGGARAPAKLLMTVRAAAACVRFPLQAPEMGWRKCRSSGSGSLHWCDWNVFSVFGGRWRPDTSCWG